jgi:hypothetical protein
MYKLNNSLKPEPWMTPMSMPLSVDDILRTAEKPFNIIEEFAALSPKRKVLLCDHLFKGGRYTFQNTARLLWPETMPHDLRKLEQFLFSLKRRSH